MTKLSASKRTCGAGCIAAPLKQPSVERGLLNSYSQPIPLKRAFVIHRYAWLLMALIGIHSSAAWGQTDVLAAAISHLLRGFPGHPDAAARRKQTQNATFTM